MCVIGELCNTFGEQAPFIHISALKMKAQDSTEPRTLAVLEDAGS